MQNQIPNNWQKVKLGEVALLNPTVSLKKEEKYSFIPMEDLDWSKKYAFGNKLKAYKGGAKFEEGDVLFARITPCLENGKIGRTKELKDGKGFGSTEYFVIRGKENISDTDFLYYLCRSNKVRQTAINSMIGASGRQRANINSLGNYELLFPNYFEQKRISSFLSSFDNKIELNNKIAKTLEDMASAIFKEFVNNNHSDNTLSLRKIADIVKGKKPKNIFIKKIDNSKEYLLIESFTGNKQFYTNDYKVPQSLEYEPVIVMDGASSGKVFIGKDGFVGSTLAVVKVKQEYLNLKLFILFFIKNIESILISNFTGSAIPHVDRNLLVNYEVPILKNEIIEKFNRLITPVIKKQEIIKKENQKLAQMRDLLLPKLMRGEIRV